MKNEQLQNAVMCSQTMLKDAEAGNWEKVFEIEAQRRDLLDKLFSGSGKANNTEDMDNKIKQIIAINKQLEDITLKARDNARNDISSISKGRQAVSSYAQHTL